MSVLHTRIVEQHYERMGDYHPAGTAMTPMITPVMHVTYADERVLYGNYEPLYTTDGAVVPGAASLNYPDPVPAGRR